MAEFQDIVLVLVLGGGLGWLSRKARFPNAVAQVVLGVALGTAVLGWVPHTDILHILGEVGIVLLLGVSGLELGIERLKSAGRTGIGVAVAGIVLSVAAGYVASSYYGSPYDEALYVGLALGATSIGITVQVLRQYGLMHHRVADIIIAAAVIDDVIVLYLLGAAHGFLRDGLNVAAVFGFVALAIAVLAMLYLLCRNTARWAAAHSLLDGAWQRDAWVLAALALGALTTHYFGLSSVVGAFFAGLGAGDGLGREVRKRTARTLQPLILILMPFFFVMIGVQAQWKVLTASGLTAMVALLIVLAVVTKVAGAYVGAFGLDSRFERWTIGLGMTARGEVALVIVTLAFQQGHMSPAVFAALVFTTIAVSILGPLLMVPFARQLQSTSAEAILP